MCNQTWYDGVSSWPRVSCKNFGFLSSRSQCRVSSSKFYSSISPKLDFLTFCNQFGVVVLHQESELWGGGWIDVLEAKVTLAVNIYPDDIWTTLPFFMKVALLFLYKAAGAKSETDSGPSGAKKNDKNCNVYKSVFLHDTLQSNNPQKMSHSDQNVK